MRPETRLLDRISIGVIAICVMAHFWHHWADDSRRYPTPLVSPEESSTQLEHSALKLEHPYLDNESGESADEVTKLSSQLEALRVELRNLRFEVAELGRAEEPSQWEVEESRREKIAANSAQQLAAKTTFSEESPQASPWASEMDEFIAESIWSNTKLLESVDLRAFECRETLCQVEVSIANGDAVVADTAELELLGALGGRLSQVVSSESWEANNGEVITVYYLQ